MGLHGDYFFPGLLIGFFAVLAAEVLLAIVTNVTSSAIGQTGRAKRLMAQIQQIVETRVHAIEAGRLAVAQPA